jgi:hypothetical protein
MTQPPIACSLTPDQLRCAADELLPGLARLAERVVRSSDAAELHFRPQADLLVKIASVLDRERQCCRFLHFAVDAPPLDATIRLTVSGPPGTGAFLESLGPAFAATAD